jgi:hypothetical protein
VASAMRGQHDTLLELAVQYKRSGKVAISTLTVFLSSQEIDVGCCTVAAQVQEDRHGRGLIVYGIITAPMYALLLPYMYEQTLKP